MVSRFYYRNHSSGTPFVLILPGCDELVPLGKLARGWYTPAKKSGMCQYYSANCKVNFSGPTSDLRDRQFYPTSVNNGPMQMSMFAEVFLEVFDHFGWYSVALVMDRGTPAPFFRMWTEALNGQLNSRLARGHSKLTLHQFGFDSRGVVDYSGIL
ncbi:hypothetical protein BV898_05329 [Hypsibius exemplaris]|uniref:Receptor ligand binding region domain-containing protein n=1 Tax=Hypsibius exemplaris TaxID=2072580 RepID=A0A1W0WZW5_HYPEX|nr:hypothetical protein BV898_05329 [Hypsibius exemplaris]